MDKIYKFLVVTVMLLLSTAASSADCYTTWLFAYDTAESEYLSNIQDCLGVYYGSNMCINNAELQFDHAIGIAANHYDCCVMGC